MWNIFRSQLYQLKKDSFTKGIVFLLILFILLFYNDLSEVDEINGGIMATHCGMLFFAALTAMCVLAVGRICGWDFNDKTINYEVLSGHKKAEIFLVRVLLSVLIIGVVFFLCVLCIFVPGIITGGWGDGVDLGNVLLRYGLTGLVTLRMVAEVVMFSFISQNCLVGIFCSYMILGSGQVICLFGNSNLVQTLSSINTGNTLLDFPQKSPESNIIDTSISFEYGICVCASSILIGALCLCIAYLYFRKKDMK